MSETFDIFLACAPGLEPLLADEAAALGFSQPEPTAGGVTVQGDWADVARANVLLRGANRVLARIASFPVFHLAQLDKRARKVDWASVFRADMPIRLDVTCRKSKIYHAGAAAERIARAITEGLGAPVTDDAPLRLYARIDDNRCTFSVDTSGELLHRRGFKQYVGKAPLRETQAAMFLRAMGFDGNCPVIDPMCGSGTFVLEAAEVARGLAPGRGRGFAFQDLAVDVPMPAMPLSRATPHIFRGSDRDQGAITGATGNAERAGLTAVTQFTCAPVSELTRPDGAPGLVMINPPYGARIGKAGPLHGLHAALGTVLKERFAGWRVGLVTATPALVKTTGLPFKPPGPPVAHGSLKIRLYQTGPL